LTVLCSAGRDGTPPLAARALPGARFGGFWEVVRVGGIGADGGDAEVLQTSAATASADSPSVSKLPAVKSTLAVAVQTHRVCTPPFAPMPGLTPALSHQREHPPPIPANATPPISTSAKGIPVNAKSFPRLFPPCDSLSISASAKGIPAYFRQREGHPPHIAANAKSFPRLFPPCDPLSISTSAKGIPAYSRQREGHPPHIPANAKAYAISTNAEGPLLAISTGVRGFFRSFPSAVLGAACRVHLKGLSNKFGRSLFYPDELFSSCGWIRSRRTDVLCRVISCRRSHPLPRSVGVSVHLTPSRSRKREGVTPPAKNHMDRGAPARQGAGSHPAPTSAVPSKTKERLPEHVRQPLKVQVL